jgi:uncharacterized protein (TIGR02594 family)
MSCRCQPPRADSSSRRIHLAALEFVGVREVPGLKSNPLITSWIKQSAEWLDRDDSKTAWCGCFRGALGILTGTGVVPAHYRAANWAKWGSAVDLRRPTTWQQGDTIVMTRPGGNHVCLFHGIDPKNRSRIECLGGNQADAVNITSYPCSRITHVRRLA